MTDQPARRSKGAESPALFLAHALRLENEAVERYGELTHAMESHNQPDAAALFRRMAGYAILHRNEISGLAAASGGLPRLAAWEFDWGGAGDSPEAADWEDAHYLMTAHHALHAALICERKAQAYYAMVAATAADDETARLATLFAAEEAAHAALLEEWLPTHPAPSAGWADDPDPPAPAD